MLLAYLQNDKPFPSRASSCFDYFKYIGCICLIEIDFDKSLNVVMMVDLDGFGCRALLEGGLFSWVCCLVFTAICLGCLCYFEGYCELGFGCFICEEGCWMARGGLKLCFVIGCRWILCIMNMVLKNFCSFIANICVTLTQHCFLFYYYASIKTNSSSILIVKGFDNS